MIFGPADGVDRKVELRKPAMAVRTGKRLHDGLDIPWPRHMVEQFVQVQDILIGVLSNGELIAAPLDTLHWRTILPEIKNARAAAQLRLKTSFPLPQTRSS
jgi:hypothetical protein